MQTTTDPDIVKNDCIACIRSKSMLMAMFEHAFGCLLRSNTPRKHKKENLYQHIKDHAFKPNDPKTELRAHIHIQAQVTCSSLILLSCRAVALSLKLPIHI